MLIVPNFTIISAWLNKLKVVYHPSEDSNIIELVYLQKVKGISYASITLLDDILTISIYSQIKQVALQILIGEVSQINNSTFLAKVYLELREDESAKLIFCYSMPISEGITFNQFSLSLSRFEEEALQVIAELDHCDLLLNALDNNGCLKSNNHVNIYH